MKLRSALFLLFAVTVPVHGQSPLQQLATEMPKCSLQCFMKEIPLSSCAQNLTSACLCSNTALNAAIGVCAKQACTNYELLQTKNVSSKGCGLPIRNKGEKHTIVGIVGFITALVAYALRLSASLGRSGRQLSWDDATMGVVVLLAAPLAVLAPLIVKNGLGQDIWTLKPKQITDLTKFYFVGEILYILIIGISKISILFFYLRVFPARQFRNVAYGVMGLCGAYTIAFFFATIFQCSPINLVWTKWDGLHQGRCNDVHAQTWSAAGISIFLDIVIMIMPLKQLADLQMGLKKKIMVMSMFSVGIFVIVVAIIRLETLIHFAKSQNLTWDYAEAGTWSLIEIYVSIICGCMPALRMLLAKAWPRIRSTFNASKASTGTGHSGLHSTGGANTNGTGKPAKVTVKPKTGDEGDFVPLVNMENPRGKHDTSDAASEKAPSGWIMRTSSVELLNHSNASGTADMSHDSPHTWDMDKPAKGREHV